jgi:hypothetical protein
MLIHLVEDNQMLKVGVTWNIKQLVKKHKNIFHTFQFRRPKHTCMSSILDKVLTIDQINVTKTSGILVYNDTMGLFDRVINCSALLDLSSSGFPKSTTIIIGKCVATGSAT